MSTDSKISDTTKAIAATGTGAAAGAAGAVGAVSSAGAVSGLSAAGITSGLAAVGGGSMLGGLVVIAAAPIAAGAAGYGAYRLAKWAFSRGH